LTKWEGRNSGLFNEFWVAVDAILKTGQKIYWKNPVKLNDYNVEVILNKVMESVMQ